MQIKIFFILLMVSLLPFNLFAESSCRSVAWPFSDNSQDLNTEKLNAIERPHLYAYLYNELSANSLKRKPGLAKKLLWYLKSTELIEAKLNLITALEWAADLDNPKATVISIEELCALEVKVLREPASSKKKK